MGMKTNGRSDESDRRMENWDVCFWHNARETDDSGTTNKRKYRKSQRATAQIDGKIREKKNENEQKQQEKKSKRTRWKTGDDRKSKQIIKKLTTTD